MQHKVGFTKGINQDLAKDKYSNQNYFTANNIKVITGAGMSTGSIENEKGNSLLFQFPTVGVRYKVAKGAAGTTTINGQLGTLLGSETIEEAYNKIIGITGVQTLIDNSQLYIFYNDLGVFIQVLDTSVAVTGNAYTTQSAATSDIYICGWTRLNEWLIVFTSDSETNEPTSALCQIWKFKFKSGSRTQIDGTLTATPTTLETTEHLIYNDNLNYSTVTYIRDVVANYETSAKGRVYWTDYFNDVRVANVLDDTLMETKPNDLNLVAEVTFGKPIITEVGDGNLPYGATYQYYYKLLSLDGRESIFSPGSALIDVQEKRSDDPGVGYFDLDSSPAGSGNGKSVTININDLDSDYDVVELYAVIYESLDSPVIYKVDDYAISGDSITLVHSTLEGNINISRAEFMEIGTPFTCKTLEDRDKQLVAGNIKETKFDPTFDARAYRFDSGSTFDLLDSEGNVEYSAKTSSQYTDIADDADAVNPTNDDTNATYNIDSANKQIYKADGSTVGGEGPNISYTFASVNKVGSTGSDALKDDSAIDEGYNINDSRITWSIDSGIDNLDGTNIVLDLNGEMRSEKSVLVDANFQGYARGEVYRFGIVFYSKSGQRSYVKWIGDIKMPDPSYTDGTNGDDYRISDAANPTHCVPGDQTDTQTYTFDLYPVFTVDISSIQSDISGFEIVRVQRTAQDRTRLGTGIIHNLVDYATGDGTALGGSGLQANSILRTYTNTAAGSFYEGSTNTTTAYTSAGTRVIGSKVTVGTTTYGDSATGGSGTPNTTLMLPDIPIMVGHRNSTFGGVTDTELKRLNVFHSPLTEFDNYTGFKVQTSTDYIREYGYYTVSPFIYNDDFQNGSKSSADFDDFDIGILYRAKQFHSERSNSNTPRFFELSAGRKLGLGEVIFDSTDDLLDDITFPISITSGGNTPDVEAISNTSFTYSDGAAAKIGVPFGLGTAKYFLNLKQTGSWTWSQPASQINFHSGSVVIGNNWSGYHDDTNNLYMKEVAYCRQVTNQYGGSSYEARSKNEYITTGAYQIIDNDSATSQTVSAFGGDVYTVSFDNLYMRPYHTWQRDDGHTQVPFKDAGSKFSVGLVYCAETPINTSWRTGVHFGNENDGDTTNRHRGSLDSSGLLTKGELSSGESFVFDDRHNQEDIVRTDYIAKDFLAQDETIFPNRFRVSRTKLDGELVDNWRSFPPNQLDHVDGSLGEIHKLISYKDQLVFFQDRGVGIIPINERSLIEDVTGAELVLGDGDLIGKYRYLTETSGTKHQHSVVATDKGVYYYDSSQQKIYALQGESLTEALGLHGFFHSDIKEILRDSDELYKASPVGVHGVYDKKNERVLWSFLGANTIRTTSKDQSEYYEVGDIVSTASGYLQCIVQGQYLPDAVISSNNFLLLSNYTPGFTLGYRERLQAFESFYDFKPGKFLNIDDKLLSIGTTRDNGYIHEEGNYGEFYGNTFDSDITLVVMPNPNLISIFNNLEYYSEVTIDKEDVVGDTLDDIICWNEHQNTGQISLTVGTIAKRRMRTWRHKLKRDTLGTTLNSISNPRLRNYYILMKLSFTNGSNKRLVLSDVVISYTPTKM